MNEAFKKWRDEEREEKGFWAADWLKPDIHGEFLPLRVLKADPEKLRKKLSETLSEAKELAEALSIGGQPIEVDEEKIWSQLACQIREASESSAFGERLAEYSASRSPKALDSLASRI